MERIALPHQTRGSWESAVFLTYGFEAPFFERVIWRELPDTCRDVTVLCDGHHFREMSQLLSEDQSHLRHLGINYACAGIEQGRAAHAKMLLLLAPNAGRLLVGSGNIGMQGFASGGEVFTRFEYSAEDAESLPEFVAARRFVDGIVQAGWVSESGSRRLRDTWDRYGWILQQLEAPGTVRSNLESSFIDQLGAAISGDAVGEIIVASAFHDARLRAIRDLVRRLNPTKVTLLVQPGRTSIDPSELRRLLVEMGDRLEVRPCHSNIADAIYLHAKFYVIRSGEREYCLAGSPNLSQVAMARTAGDGNIELAVLTEGAAGAFDYMLEGLKLEDTVMDVSHLGLELATEAMEAGDDEPSITLTAAAFTGLSIALQLSGEIPCVSTVTLVLAGRHRMTVAVTEQTEQHLATGVPADLTDWLQRPLTISVEWPEALALPPTNPVFLHNERSLRSYSNKSSRFAPEVFTRIGDAVGEDEELLELVRAMDSTLLIDQSSLWQVVGQPSKAREALASDEPVEMAYEDINFEAHRNHPRARQYLEPRLDAWLEEANALEIMLAEVGAKLAGADSRVVAKPAPAETDYSEEPEPESEAEAEQAVQIQDDRRRQTSSRTAGALRRFIRRWLTGFNSPRFKALVGAHVVARNYVLFLGFLGILLEREWLDDRFLVGALIEASQVLLGDQMTESWFASLAEADREMAEAIMRDEGASPQLYALIEVAASIAWVGEWNEELARLQSLLRRRLVVTAGTDLEWSQVTRVVAEHAATAEKTAREVAADLRTLAEWETAAAFTARVTELVGVPHRRPCFEIQQVKRPQVGGGSLPYEATQLVVDLTSEASPSVAELGALLAELRRRAPEVGYFRVAVRGPDGESVRLALADDAVHECYVYDFEARQELSMDSPAPVSRPWDEGLRRVATAATGGRD